MKKFKMKNLITLIIFSTILFSCNSPIDSSPWSGTINQNDEKTKIVVKLAKGYETGTFEIAKEYFTEDGIHTVNDAKYTTNEIIQGYNFHSELFDDLKHVDPIVTTMKYNNNRIFTNQWSGWSATSKITGEKHELKFYCAWQWEGEKIVGTECFFDTAIIQKEMALYQEKMNAE